ncbi:MAG: arginine--tRNA ligase [Acidobacteriota bacterium]
MPKTPPFQAAKAAFAAAVAHRIQTLYGDDHAELREPDVVVQTSPDRALGDLATPTPLHLARVLRRRPRDIAEEIADGLEPPRGIERTTVEGAGYLNAFLDRSAFVADVLAAPLFAEASERPKIIVEHTNINPNKAAHIGHLRNAVLGDVLVRSLRRLGHPVEVQNYIDDTGVQLADVVVGFCDLRGLDRDAVAALDEPFDYLCWDLYSEVGRWYEAHPERLELRRSTLHQLEAGEGERAELGTLVARRIVRRHLATMARLDVDYDLLTHESDILALDFFASAFDRLRASGAVRLDTEGKNAGCWVMPLSQSAEFAGLEDPDKVIVRSDGTVTYVGKDIAYQLWKFGLLGRDFEYRRWAEIDGDEASALWATTHDGGVSEHPDFGGGQQVINVIDARQSYLQKIVRAGLQALGHADEAERSIHFAYEMVSLSRSTAEQLGYLDPDDEQKTLEMSGRKGIGVKADDLLDMLEERCRASFAERHDDLNGEALDDLARRMAIAALRFFMVKATTTRVIAFDFDEALQLQGESGPYLQYSLVRERNIRRKLEAAGEPTEVDASTVRQLPADVWADDLWDLALAAAQVPEAVERAATSLELSIIAREAFELAGRFHSVYRVHRIFGEADDHLRHARMAANQAFRKALEALADLLGVPILDRM